MTSSPTSPDRAEWNCEAVGAGSTATFAGAALLPHPLAFRACGSDDN